MKRRDSTTIIALGLSLAVHGLLLWGVSRFAAAHWYAASPPPALRAASRPVAIWMQTPPPPDQIGQMTGRGQAIRSAAGEGEFKAKQANQDQPFLSRSPAEILEQISKSGKNGDGQPAGTPAAAVSPLTNPPPPAIPFGVGADDSSSLPSIQPVKQAPASTAAEQSGQTTLVNPVQKNGNEENGADTSKRSGSPGLPGDSDIDPFSKGGSVEMHPNGRVVARFGRKVKTTRPHFTIASFVDMGEFAAVTVVLKVNVDATGRVTNVQVLQSGGTDEIDHPLVTAVYDWWIEPPKDQQGRPLADVAIWRFHIQ